MSAEDRERERQRALLLAGEIIGMLGRLTPAKWRELAETADLKPAYRRAILTLAAAAEDLKDDLKPLRQETKGPPDAKV